MNQIRHIVFNVNNLERASKFYNRVFGWESIIETGTSTIMKTGGPVGAAMVRVDTEIVQGGVIAYMEVEDVLEAMKRVRKAGGDVVKEITEIPGYGSEAICVDTENNLIGLWKPYRP